MTSSVPFLREDVIESEAEMLLAGDVGLEVPEAVRFWPGMMR